MNICQVTVITVTLVPPVSGQHSHYFCRHTSSALLLVSYSNTTPISSCTSHMLHAQENTHVCTGAVPQMAAASTSHITRQQSVSAVGILFDTPTSDASGPLHKRLLWIHCCCKALQCLRATVTLVLRPTRQAYAFCTEQPRQKQFTKAHTHTQCSNDNKAWRYAAYPSEHLTRTPTPTCTPTQPRQLKPQISLV